MKWLASYVVVLVVAGILDALWIGLIARKQYELEAGDALRAKPQISAGWLFYLVYTAGIVAFAVLPMSRHFDGIHATLATYRDVAAWGAGLGIFAYSTFALTNQAIIKDWSYKLVCADVFWGGFLSAVTTLAGFVAYRALA